MARNIESVRDAYHFTRIAGTPVATEMWCVTMMAGVSYDPKAFTYVQTNG